ncbi:MAG: hypothetical protein HQM16_17635 [Deltaproteobacteria bacterium]|nr:hypothetical protein [Deltaproteobacteria bacterium]
MLDLGLRIVAERRRYVLSQKKELLSRAINGSWWILDGPFLKTKSLKTSKKIESSLNAVKS